MDDFDSIPSMGPNLSSSDEGSSSGGSGQNVFGNMFSETNPEIKSLVDNLTENSHIVSMIPFAGSIFKSGGLFKDTPFPSLLSFIDLSGFAPVKVEQLTTITASLLKGKGSGQSR